MTKRRLRGLSFRQRVVWAAWKWTKGHPRTEFSVYDVIDVVGGESPTIESVLQ